MGGGWDRVGQSLAEPQPCLRKRTGEVPSQEWHSRVWGWARTQAKGTGGDGPIAVRSALA